MIVCNKLEVHPQAKGLIFDIDGTLADTMLLHYEAWCKILIEKGVNYPKKMFYELAGIPTIKIVPVINKTFGLNLDPEETVKRKEGLFLKLFHKVKPIEEVIDIVYKYHNKLPMSLGTGSRRHIADKIIETLGLKKYFNIIITAEDVENHKPHPDTFLKCAKLMNVEPKFCQVFEDGEQGLEAGRRAGMIITDVRPFLV